MGLVLIPTASVLLRYPTGTGECGNLTNNEGCPRELIPRGLFLKR